MKLKKIITLFILGVFSVLVVAFCTLSLIILYKIFSGEVFASDLGHGSEFLSNEAQGQIDRDINFQALPFEVVKDNGIKDFSLSAPTISLSHTIVPHVDPTAEEVYLGIIEREIAHGLGTYTPELVYSNQKGITYLFAHSSGSAPIFKDLKFLNEGDRIFLHYNSHTYVYKVSSKKVVSAKDIAYYTSVSDFPLLRLQTCENGELDRLIVDAKLAGRI
jgi:LPXTG-site transpeptidase (sortase) family protein